MSLPELTVQVSNLQTPVMGLLVTGRHSSEILSCCFNVVLGTNVLDEIVLCDSHGQSRPGFNKGHRLRRIPFVLFGPSPHLGNGGSHFDRIVTTVVIGYYIDMVVENLRPSRP